MSRGRPDAYQKALQINRDAEKHGTFAEIGAGQEVARWFFHVGGAAGTVAKTISAYDMAVSNAIYGPSDRYVSRKRLYAMLDHEYDLLLERLDKKRGDKTAFFVFADTVATRSYSHREVGDGWLGVRFQTKPKKKPSDIIIHVHILDKENIREQEALGIVGVNLIHAAFYHHDKPEKLIGMLVDNLTPERIEVDMIKFSGPDFEKVDNRLMSLQLVEQKLTDAAMFRADGEVVQPAEVLYKRPVLVERGSFRPATNLTLDMLERAEEQFLAGSDLKGTEPVVLMEMTLRNLLAGGKVDHSDFLARVNLLAALGKMVMVSRFAEYYRLVEFLSRYTKDQSIVIALGVPTLKEVFNRKYYNDLAGGLLEAMGRLFKNSVKLLVYPFQDEKTGALITAEKLVVARHLRHLYSYLLENHRIESIREFDRKCLPISPQDVLTKIQSGDPAWQKMVPASVAKTIRTEKLFGFKSNK